MNNALCAEQIACLFSAGAHWHSQSIITLKSATCLIFQRFLKSKKWLDQAETTQRNSAVTGAEQTILPQPAF